MEARTYGHTLGDTVMMNWPALFRDVTDSAFRSSFNRAIRCDSVLAELEPRTRLLQLYLTALFPLDVVFLIDSARELDYLYNYFWTPHEMLENDYREPEWDSLLSPGLHLGSNLLQLPNLPSPRNLPLPSIELERFDASWFDLASRVLQDKNKPVQLTIFSARTSMLLQLEVVQAEDSGCIDYIGILRAFDFSRHFLAPYDHY
jgi:hypothetical protein